jgi:large subunit ribosomal protein L37Ae
MAKKTKFGSVKRLGARYGKTVKSKLGKIESLKKHKCPYCHHVKVHRLAAGIWHCNKCDSKFTGKAYYVEKR